MDPEERDRLVRLETNYLNLIGKLDQMAHDVQEIKKFAYMGKGAWSLIIRIGAFVTIVGYAISWAWDHIERLMRHA
jgi:hypothetical protein